MHGCCAEACRIDNTKIQLFIENDYRIQYEIRWTLLPKMTASGVNV